MSTNIVAWTAKATTNHHLSHATTLIFDRVHRGRGAVRFAFAKKVKNWIIEIGRSLRWLLEVVVDFFFFFFFFLDFLDPTSFERFLSCLGEIVSEGGSKATCHDEVEEAGDPAAKGAG